MKWKITLLLCLLVAGTSYQQPTRKADTVKKDSTDVRNSLVIAKPEVKADSLTNDSIGGMIVSNFSEAKKIYSGTEKKISQFPKKLAELELLVKRKTLVPFPLHKAASPDGIPVEISIPKPDTITVQPIKSKRRKR